MIKNQEWASDMMMATPDYWARLADYILLYDQIVIPTGNLQILPVLRLMLGEGVFDELIRTKAIVLARYDQWFGYVGTGGVIFFRVGDNPDLPKSLPNLAVSHFKPLDEAIDDASLLQILRRQANVEPLSRIFFSITLSSFPPRQFSLV